MKRRIFEQLVAWENRERALTSLKYFCELASEYHVIAAGSLPGIAINREKYSFPVGKVDELNMYPLCHSHFTKEFRV